VDNLLVQKVHIIQTSVSISIWTHSYIVCKYGWLISQIKSIFLFICDQARSP